MPNSPEEIHRTRGAIMAILTEHWHWILWVGLVGVCYLLMRVIARPRPTSYQGKGRLYPRKTLKLWQALVISAEDDWLVLPDVNLNRLIEGRPVKRSHNPNDAIGSWTLDFVVVDPIKGEPQAAIQVVDEPDDADEQDEDYVSPEIESAFTELKFYLDQIEVPLFVIERQKAYDVEELRDFLAESIIGERPRKRRRRSA